MNKTHVKDKKRVLITGGAGFIGSHLCETFINKGDKVTCLDNLFSGSVKNIKHLNARKNFEFIKGNVLDKKLADKLVKKCDVVYHLAAVVGVDVAVNNPREDILVNFLGTKNVAESALKYKKKIVFTSSSEVYGKNQKNPLNELSNSVFGPTDVTRWAYGNTKSLCEHLLYSYKAEGLNFSAVRFFNVYGPGSLNSLYANVIPKFICQALENKPLTVYSNGFQKRSFTYVDDAVSGLILSAKKLENDVTNIGNGKPIAIITLAKKIIKLTGSKSKIKFINFDKIYNKKFEDAKIRIPDITKAVKLGFLPKVDLNAGLKKTIAWIKNNPNEN